MNKRPTSDKSRNRRSTAVVVAAVLLAVAAAGIAALNQNIAHAIRRPAGDAVTALPRAADAAPNREWRPSASDASVPPASEVFRGRSTPGADELPATF